MKFVQTYDPLSNLLLSALIAGIPLILLLYLLGIRRVKGYHAALLGTGSAVILAITIWGMPVSMAVSATLNGMLYGIFPIVWIVITAIWVYNMTVESGEFEIIKNSLASVTDDRRLQAILIGFAFGAFLEGTAGFGTPVAITAAMLVGLGFSPIYAAGICMIANTAPVAFGAIGIPIAVAAQVSGLDIMHISQVIGRQLPFLSVLIPLWLVVTMAGWKRGLEIWPAALVAGVLFAGAQFVTANYVNPYLPDITAAIITIVGFLAFLKIWKPKNVWHFPDEKLAIGGKAVLQYSQGEVVRAWAPFLILAVLVFLWADDKYIQFKQVLVAVDKLFPYYLNNWPGLDGMVFKTVPIVAKNTPYAATFMLNLASASGTALLLSGLLSLFVIPNYGLKKAVACLGRTVEQLKFPIYTISLILGLAYIMNYSGMSSTLGIAFTATGSLFPFFSPILGWLGVFLTGSDTSANALFGSMQKTAAEQIGVDPYLTVGANSSGGVCGKMISPQSISVATAASGLVGKEGDLLRFTLWQSIIMVLAMSMIVYLQAYWFKWMLP